MITRDEAYELLKKYNKEDFHLHHGRMVEEPCVILPINWDMPMRLMSGV